MAYHPGYTSKGNVPHKLDEEPYDLMNASNAQWLKWGGIPKWSLKPLKVNVWPWLEQIRRKDRLCTRFLLLIKRSFRAVLFKQVDWRNDERHAAAEFYVPGHRVEAVPNFRKPFPHRFSLQGNLCRLVHCRGLWDMLISSFHAGCWPGVLGFAIVPCNFF